MLEDFEFQSTATKNPLAFRGLQLRLVSLGYRLAHNQREVPAQLRTIKPAPPAVGFGTAA